MARSGHVLEACQALFTAVHWYYLWRPQEGLGTWQVWVPGYSGIRHQQDLIASLMVEPWSVVCIVPFTLLCNRWKDIASIVGQGSNMLKSSMLQCPIRAQY